MPAILTDLGGVLVHDNVHDSAARWATRLAISPTAFLTAVYGGNDTEVLTGHTTEDAWWQLVQTRLTTTPATTAEIRADLTTHPTWNHPLLTALRALPAKTAIVSNAWPHARTALSTAGLLDQFDAVVLSCEIGHAKPDPRIYRAALALLDATPADSLFIDDTPTHVTAAQSLGILAHLHTTTPTTLARIHHFLSHRPGTITP